MGKRSLNRLSPVPYLLWGTAQIVGGLFPVIILKPYFAKILIALITGLFINLDAWAQVTEQWIEVDSIEDSAEPIAQVLAGQIASKLRAEGTKIIFLNLAFCSAPAIKDTLPIGFKYTPDAQRDIQAESERTKLAWCQGFQTALERSLITGGIKFLPETARDSIRAALAAEAGYQHGSMQVDVTKAVELGKQQAFQAFVNVVVTDAGPGKAQANARSINVRDGVVNISEQARVTMKADSVRSTGVKVAAYSSMGIGLITALYGHAKVSSTNEQSKKDYRLYKAASSSEEAVSYREKVEDSDAKAKLAGAVAGLGWGLFFGGAVYHWLSGDKQVSYRLASQEERNEPQAKDTFLLSLAPFWERDLAGIQLDFSF